MPHASEIIEEEEIKSIAPRQGLMKYQENRENGTYTSTLAEVPPEAMKVFDAFKDSSQNAVSPNKKKKKKAKKEKTDELEPLRQEAIRLSLVPNTEKPYHYKPETNSSD